MTVATRPRATSGSPRTRRGTLEAVLLAAMTVVLLAFFLAIYPYRGFRLPIGPDAPVYLWWSRLAVHEHLSAVGDRAGLPALALMLAASLHMSLVQALAGLGAALGAATGLGAAALVRACPELPLNGHRSRVAASVLAGLLAGTFAVHLAGGYFANLALVVVFLGALALLAGGATPGAVGAAGLLAAGMVAHPPFFLVAVAILVLTALPTVVSRPDGQRLRDTEGARILAATGAGGLLGGAGLGAIVLGGAAYRTDTSKDAFLRRVGLEGDVRADYLDRLARHLARYWLPVSVPAGAFAAFRSGGFLGRLLRAWGVVAVVGVLGALATGLVPADRFITFAFVLPIGSAVGIAWLALRLARRSRLLASSVAVVLVGLILAGATVTWLRARPFITPPEMRLVNEAARFAETLPAETPLVFVVDNRRSTISFFATQAGNVIRGVVPADRIRDVYLYVGSPARYLSGQPTLLDQPGRRAAVIHDAMSRLYLAELRAAGGRPVAFVLQPFDPAGFRAAQDDGTGTVVAPGVVILGTPPPSGPSSPGSIGPASSWGIVAAGVALLLSLGLVGLGWALAARTGDLLGALALAPAFGIAALLLAGVLADGVGASLSGATPPAAGAAVALAGYAAAYLVRSPRPPRPRTVLERGAAADTPKERPQ